MGSAYRGGRALLAAMLLAAPAHAEKKYGPGVSDKEIKLGQTMSYSGALSVFGTIGRTEAAYFEKLNAAGGINGRKINLISLDDGYAPPENGRADAQAGRAGRSARSVQLARYADQCRDPQIRQRAQGAAPVPVDGRFQMGRSSALSLDHGLGAQLSAGSADLCEVHPEELPACEDRHALPERRLRQRLPEGISGRSGRTQRADDRRVRPLMSRPTRPWIRRSPC